MRFSTRIPWPRQFTHVFSIVIESTYTSPSDLISALCSDHLDLINDPAIVRALGQITASSIRNDREPWEAMELLVQSAMSRANAKLRVALRNYIGHKTHLSTVLKGELVLYAQMHRN